MSLLAEYFALELSPLTEESIFSLTVITLTVEVIYTTVFEYQNQVILNMTGFDGGPSLS